MTAKKKQNGISLFPEPIQQEKPKLNLNPTEVLALDVATSTGWATTTTSGTWNLAPKKDESRGMRLIRFRAKLTEMITLHKIKLVVFEGAVGYGAHPNFVGAEMIGVMKLTLEELNINYAAFVPSVIKKFATGKGNAKKPDMIRAAQLKWNMTGKDDNEADALAILHYALYEFGIVKPESII